MNKPPGKTPIDEAKERARRALEKGYAHVRTGVREGVTDARVGTLQVPPKGAFVRTFIFGVSLPGNLLRLGWRNAETRESILARLRAPVGIFTATTLLLVLHLVHLLPRPIDDLVVGVGSALSGVSHTVQSCMPNPTSIVSHDDDKDDAADAKSHRDKEKARPRKHLDGVDAGADDEEEASPEEQLAQTADELRVELGEVAHVFGAADGGAPAGGAESIVSVLKAIADDSDAGPAAEKAAAVKKAASAGAKVASAAKAAKAAKKRRQHKTSDDDDDDDDDQKPKGLDALGVLAALYALEWILIWIWREQHDAIACEVSALAGIPCEGMKGPPVLRFDVGFLKLKLWRAIRFFLFTVLVLPAAGYVALLLLIAGSIVGLRVAVGWVDVFLLQAAVLAASAYWGAVFGAANAFVAWEEPPAGWEPRFIVWARKAGQIPVLGYPMRAYAGLLKRATKNVWPACRAFEEAPVESVAMMVGKVLVVVPGVYLVLRPLFGPAATHLIVARRARDGAHAG